MLAMNESFYAKLNASQQVTVSGSNQDSLLGQLNRYLTAAGQGEDTSGSALEYWSRNRHLYTKLTKCCSIPSLRQTNFLSLWLADFWSKKSHGEIIGDACVFKTEQNAVTL